MEKTEISDGSLRLLWRISFPLMISFLSQMTMLFVDRLFLSKYSAPALAAAASAGTLSWSFNLGWVTLAAMAEVFVAQSNGAKNYREIGRAPWQMIWVALFSILFFTPLAFQGAEAFYGGSGKVYELQYFRYLMLMSPFSVLLSALTAFFVGQGKTRIIQFLSILGNGINIGLDALFIFRFGWGVKGAAIATGTGVAVQAAILLYLFLRKSNRLEFGTNRYHLDIPLLKKILRVGLPPALLCSMEIGGWAFFYHMMDKISPTHLFVCSVCQSILLLFIFFGLGLEKGAAAVTGNLIGAGKYHEVKNVLKSGLKTDSPF